MNSSRPLQKLTRAQLIAQLESEIAQVNRQRLARRLVREYICYYDIFPHGVDLIAWLSFGSSCRTNTEALVDWVEVQLAEIGMEFNPDETPASIQIAHRLERVLATAEASIPC